MTCFNIYSECVHWQVIWWWLMVPVRLSVALQWAMVQAHWIFLKACCSMLAFQRASIHRGLCQCVVVDSGCWVLFVMITKYETWDLGSRSHLRSANSHCCELPRTMQMTDERSLQCWPGTVYLQSTNCRQPVLLSVIFKLFFSLTPTDLSYIALLSVLFLSVSYWSFCVSRQTYVDILSAISNVICCLLFIVFTMSTCMF